MEENIPLNWFQTDTSREVKRKIYSYEQTIESFKEKVLENEGSVTFVMASDMFEYLNKERHDIFLNMVQDHLNMDITIGDESPKDVFLNHLNNMGLEEEALKYEILFNTDPYSKYIKTPDIFQVVNNRSGNIDHIIVADIAVTVNPTNVMQIKFDKYRETKMLFEGIRTYIEVICYDLVESKVKTHGELNYDFSDMNLKEFQESIQKSDEIKDEIKRNMKERDLVNLNNWLVNSKTVEDEGAKVINDFDFKINLEELIQVIEKNKHAKDFFYNTDKHHMQTLIDSMSMTNIKQEDDHIIEKFANKLGVIYSKVEETEYVKAVEEKYFGMMMDHDAKNVPSPPNQEQIDEAFINLEENSKDMYEVMTRKRLLNPLYFNFSKNELTKSFYGAILKKKRMEKILVNIEGLKKEGIIKALDLIFTPAKANDKIYLDSVLKGETYVKEDGSIISKEDYIKEQKIRHRNIRKLIIKKEEEPNRYEYRNRDLSVVSYKKGEVIYIRPHNIKEIMDIMKDCGMNLKTNIEERSKVEKKKVKSLPFWDSNELEELSEQFITEAYRLENECISIGKNLDNPEFKEFMENKIDVSSDESTSTMTSEESDKDEEDKQFERGLKYFFRHNELLWENISFAAQMGGEGFRLVQGLNDNSFILIMPCESIMKGDKGVPFINISIHEKGDIHNNFGDELCRKITNKNGDKLLISMGRRVDRPRLEGYLQAKLKYYTALSILNHNRIESNKPKMNRLEQSKLALLCCNININTSSLLDNVRYMAENCLADYSFCKLFIEDKFNVPIKNVVQAYLFKRTKELLTSLRKEMQKVRVKKALVNDDNEANIETSRVTKGEFSSLLDPHMKYKKPDHILSEIYTLFFVIPKGLHGNFHVMLEIHKTPISIEREIRELHGSRIPMTRGFPETRYQFNPEMIVISTLEAERNMTNSFRSTRNTFEVKERPHETPLRIRTLSSTRSTLIEDSQRVEVNSKGGIDLEDNILLSEVKENEFERLNRILTDLEIRIEQKSKNECRREYKNLKSTLKDEESFPMSSKTGRKQLVEFFDNKIRLNPQSKTLEHRVDTFSNDYKWKVNQIIKTKTGKDTKFYRSGPVLTTILEEALKEEIPKNGERTLESIAIKAKKSVLSDKNWTFAIRKKGQRTQKDREIYVTDIECKKALYILEHYYKQVCYNIIEEKISEPGDFKIISMEKQVKAAYTWMARESRRFREENKGTVLENPVINCFHFNIDMTKWAPKDNLFKFMFMISSNHGLTVREKFYMYAVLCKLSSKKLHIEDELFYKVHENSKKKDRINVDDPDDELFCWATRGFRHNQVNIVLTWLQGQLNYASSLVHAGAALLWKKFLQRRMPTSKFLFQLNVHSDDNQSTVCSIRDPDISQDKYIRILWNYLDFITRSCCIELSNKKSNISQMIKQFVSQYNIATQQVYLWCKPIMSTVSGCPYTTLKDDMSSTISKVSEALSKGAPKSIAAVTLKEVVKTLWNLYGIRTKKQENFFSKNLSVDHMYLPEYLGGDHIFDYTTLAIGGPRTRDQMAIAELLKYTGATMEKEANTIPKKDIQRAILLYYVSDLLASETLEDEEDVSTSTSINPTKPVRFKNRRTGNNDPFKNVYMMEKEERVKLLKKESPGLGLLKPLKAEDLISYYMILYNNANFKSSMAGQSPAVLHLHKIANRKNGLFRIKNSDNISLTKFQEGRDKDNMTAQELSELLVKMINSTPYSNDIANHLRSKFLIADTEFRILNYATTNAIKTTAVIRKNPQPKKKPSSDEYSTIINRIPILLCYFFDENYFQRNGFRIQYPAAVPTDLAQLNDIFRVEFSWLRREIMESKAKIREGLMKEEDFKYNNYLYEVERLAKDEAEKLKMNVMYDSRDRYVQQERSMIQNIWNLEEIKRTGGSAPNLEPTTTNSKNLVKESFDIYSRLVSDSKLVGGRTSKVIFCSPTKNNELHDIAIATKTQVESAGDVCVGFFLSHNQKLELRGIKNNIFRGSKSDMFDFINQLSNVVVLLKRFSATDEQIIQVIKNSKINDIDISVIDKEYLNLPRPLKRASVVMLSIVNSAKSFFYVSKFEDMTVVWLKSQSMGDPGFIAKVYYENMMVHLEGYSNTIKSIQIYFKGPLLLFYLNRLVKMFIADLIFRDRTKYNRVDLSTAFDTFPITKKYRNKSIGISTMKNEFINADSSSCSFAVKGLNLVRENNVKLTKRITDVVILMEDLSIEYKLEGGEKNKIYLNPNKSIGTGEIEVPDIKIQMFDLNRMLKSYASKCIIEERCYDITTDEVIMLHLSPSLICTEYGTCGSSICYRMLLGDDIIKNTINMMDEWVRDKRSALKKYNVPLDSDDDDEETFRARERAMSKFPHKTLLEHMNKFSESYVNAEEVMNLKLNEWDNLMKLTHDQDLRSVRKAVAYMITEKEFVERFIDETTPEDQIHDYLSCHKIETIQKIKEGVPTYDITEYLLEESQLYVFSELDKQMFRLTMHILKCALYSNQHKQLFKYIDRKLNQNVKSYKYAQASLCSITCYLLGSDYVSNYESTFSISMGLDDMFRHFMEFYKKQKRDLSIYIVCLCEILKSSIDAMNENKESKGNAFLSMFGGKTKMPPMSKQTQKRRKGKNTSNSSSEPHETKSMSRSIKKNVQNKEDVDKDPRTLISTLEQSTIQPGTTDATASEFSGSETSSYLVRGSKGLIGFAKDLPMNKQEELIELDEQGLDAIFFGGEGDVEEDEIWYQDENEFN